MPAPDRNASVICDSARSAPSASRNAPGRYSVPSGSASANACSSVSENRPAAGSQLTYPPAACPRSHAATCRGSVPVRRASSSAVAGPSARLRYRPRRCPTTTFPAAMVAPRSPTNRPSSSPSLSCSMVMLVPFVRVAASLPGPRLRLRQRSVNRGTAVYNERVLQVRLLGGVAADHDGEQLSLLPPVSRLLAVLALRPGPQDREALSARLWPGAGGPAARGSPRTAGW